MKNVQKIAEEICSSSKADIKFINADTGKILKIIKRTLISSKSGQEFFRWKGRDQEIDGFDHEDKTYIVRLFPQSYNLFDIKEN